MTYQEAVNYLSGLTETRIKPGLERITRALKVLGSPNSEYPQIIIGGTNGKGSTAAFMGSVLDAAGYRAGLFTSPHLYRFEERIRVGNQFLPPEELSLSYFEFTTAMALLYFSRAGVDLALLEVGLGGRWDATNAVDPVLSVVTSVAMDHCDWLGDTLEQVALEKVQILRPGRPGILGRIPQEVKEVVVGEAGLIGAQIYLLDRDFHLGPLEGKLVYSGLNRSMEGFDLGLKGPFQLSNAACAVAALESLEKTGFTIPTGAVSKGLTEVKWPGRYHVVQESPRLIVDSAHNPDAVVALINALEGTDGPLVWLFSALKDKDIRGMAELIDGAGGSVYLVELDHPRAASVVDLREIFKGTGLEIFGEDSVSSGLEKALSKAGRRGTLVVAGSVYLAGTVLGLLEEFGENHPGYKA
jgi:dihydrofolate synthase/folylpolyglutamate synthase